MDCVTIHPRHFSRMRVQMMTAMACLVLWQAGALPSPAGQAQQTVTYHGIRPTDPGGRLGLRNPERGWRIETLIAEPHQGIFSGPAAHLWGRVPPVYQDDWWLMDAQRYEPFGLTLVQAYCYLTEYADGPIPPDKLDRLQHSLDLLRRNGFKALLRFAYEKNMNAQDGPRPEVIFQHIDQLRPVLQQNADVIYVLQAGFIGAWGEWHSATHVAQDDYGVRAAIIKRLLEVLPADRMLQLRVPKYKRLALSQSIFPACEEVDQATAFGQTPAARIGFHNDGFLAGPSHGGTWPEPPLFGQSGNTEYDSMTRESAYVPVDGELFWSDQGFDGQAAGGQGVDGLNASIHLREHHYASFSLAHSYSEREGRAYSIDRWLAALLDPQALQAANMPIADGYFEDGLGQPVVRTQFEYIQDHLGYRLELQDASFPTRCQPGDELTVAIELINRGFSTLHNPRPVSVALIDVDGKVWEQVSAEVDPRAWQPCAPGDPEFRPLRHALTLRGKLPTTLRAGWYQVGLWMPDADPSLRLDPRYAVRVANRDVMWWTDADGHYGINILGTCEVVDSP